jgi:hypothetical protein
MPDLTARIRVLMISKACLVGAYQRKLEEIAACPDIDLTVVVPPEWREPGGAIIHLERAHVTGYELLAEPMAFNGNFHLHFYPRLGRHFARVRPHIVHIDEEPYNLATFQAMWLSRRCQARALFFTWQNLNRSYPFPFNWIERYNLRCARFGIAGNHEAMDVWRAKGYTGPMRAIPQLTRMCSDREASPNQEAKEALRLGVEQRGSSKKKVWTCCCARRQACRACGACMCWEPGRSASHSKVWRANWGLPTASCSTSRFRPRKCRPI